jgi:xanthine dehydrogenase large subunit
VHFFEKDDNVETVARSKAVGEPPLMLALSVWAAVRHALDAAGGASVARRSVSCERFGESVSDASPLRLPATHEEILRCLSAARTTTLAPRAADLQHTDV